MDPNSSLDHDRGVYLKEWLVVTLGAGASSLVAEPLSDFLNRRLGEVQFFICLVVLLFLLLWNVRIVQRGSRTQLWRVFRVVAFASLVMTIVVFREPLKRQVVEAFGGPGRAPLGPGEQHELLLASLDDVVKARTEAGLGANPLAITNLKADYAVRGRTGSFSLSGEATPIGPEGIPSVFYFTLCSDASSIDQSLAPYLLTASFGNDADHLVEARLNGADAVQVTSQDPLTFRYAFSLGELAKESATASAGKFRFKVDGCWPGGVWRLLDMVLLDTRILGAVHGNIDVAFVAPYEIRLERGQYSMKVAAFSLARDQARALTDQERVLSCARTGVPPKDFRVGLGFSLASPKQDEMDVFQVSRPQAAR